MRKFHRLPELDPAFLASSEGLVLLETGRTGAGDGKSYLFADPTEVIMARTPGEIPAALGPPRPPPQ